MIFIENIFRLEKTKLFNKLMEKKNIKKIYNMSNIINFTQNNIFEKNNTLNFNTTKSISSKNNSNKRLYNSEYRKKLIDKFDNIKNRNTLIDVCNIIINDIGTDYSSNVNGIFINMNILSDFCIEKINQYIEDKIILINSNKYIEKDNGKIYKFDEIELLSEMGHKLSNQEKNIIKRIRNKS